MVKHREPSVVSKYLKTAAGIRAIIVHCLSIICDSENSSTLQCNQIAEHIPDLLLSFYAKGSWVFDHNVTPWEMVNNCWEAVKECLSSLFWSVCSLLTWPGKHYWPPNQLFTTIRHLGAAGGRGQRREEGLQGRIYSFQRLKWVIYEMWCIIPCIYSPKLVTSKLTPLILQPPITAVLLQLLSSNYSYRAERVGCFHFKLSPFENGHKSVFCTSLMAQKGDPKLFFKEFTTHEKCKLQSKHALVVYKS